MHHPRPRSPHRPTGHARLSAGGLISTYRQRLIESLVLTLPKRPDILAIQIAAGFVLLTLLSGIMFLVPPLQVAVSVASVLTMTYFFTRPTMALFSIFCIRGLLDLLWWIPGTIAGLNMLQLFSAAAFCLVAAQLFMDLKEFQRHPLFQFFLIYLVFISIGTLRSDSIMANADNIVRYTSPLVLSFMVTLYLNERSRRRALLVAMAWIGLIPMVLSLYHLASGQMTEYTLHGYDRLLGAYKNLHTMALMSYFFLCLWIFWIFQARSNAVRLALIIAVGLGTLAMYKSYIRTSMLSLAIFLGAYLYLRRHYRVLGISGMLVVLAVMASPVLQDRFGDALLIFDDSVMIDKRQLGSGRWGIWTYSMKTFLSHPVWDIMLGAGMGEHYTMTANWVAQFNANNVVLDPHNDFLLLLYQIGPGGIVIYVMMQLKVLGLAKQVYTHPKADRFAKNMGILTIAMTISVIFANAVSNSFIHRTSPGWYYWCICGLLVAEWFDLKAKEEQTLPAPGELAEVNTTSLSA